MLGGGDGGQGVELVVNAADVPLHAGDGFAVFVHGEIAGFALRAEAGVICRAAKRHLLAPAALGQHALQAGLAGIHDDAALRRHGAHQVVKLPLDGRQVVKNIGMVEFEVVQHRRARAVVNELAALVEKRRVVFVGLNHEGVARAQPRRHAKVQRHAADQKAGLQASAFQYPGQHGGGGGFAVRAGNGQHVAWAGGVVRRVVQHMAGQPLRPAGVGLAAVQNCFH